MFTGLIETLADVVAIDDQPPGKRIAVSAPAFCNSGENHAVQIGDSIAINGCCLTVVEIDGDRFSFEAGEETLLRTNLGKLVAESQVNLERALAVGDRLGGHYVTGHVDAIGKLVERSDDPPWAHLKFSIPAEFIHQIVAKGSITVDGISLTVVDVGDNKGVDDSYFTVALIPHTLNATTLGRCSVGDTVNLETDILAKYVQRSLQHREN
ncbi:riboflavin synthase [Allorhodopirellula solitaria]|uniref:riboflavin synthase n=1 Tax=Allorhodopirellula solitaria TaxID=2527987 RepID=UPI0011B78F67|nr:riboflavin synthase [Allorhodopirellula solitaria]